MKEIPTIGPRIGIVIQARTGSTRMPAKILRPFLSDGSTILDIILRASLRDSGIYREEEGVEMPVIVATTLRPADDAVERRARECGAEVFRGPEEDVLARFTGAAQAFGLDALIRVCSDNPFLRTDSYRTLAREYISSPADYVAYAFPDGRPTIKSHLGLYPELASVSALRRLAASSGESLVREHVTIGLYSSPGLYSIRRLPLPELLRARTDLRLTLDTPSDFALLRELYQRHGAGSLEELINLIDSEPRYGAIMSENILNNSK